MKKKRTYKKNDIGFGPPLMMPGAVIGGTMGSAAGPFGAAGGIIGGAFIGGTIGKGIDKLKRKRNKHS